MDFTNKFLSHSSSFSYPRKEAINERPETLMPYREVVDGHKTNIGGNSKRHKTLHCKSCHKTYRPSGQNRRNENINTRICTQFSGFPYQYREIDKGLNVGHSPDIMKKARFRARNVTFDLESVQTPEQEISQGKDDDDDAKTYTSTVQSRRLLKVKLNLNPIRKTKVHPNKKTVQGHAERSRSKKSKDKGMIGKERGEMRGKERSGRKKKGNSEKTKRSAKIKGSTEDNKDEKEEARERQKSKGISKLEQGEQESTSDEKGEKKHPETPEPGDDSCTADQTGLESGPLNGEHIQYQGPGLILGSVHPSQRPLTQERDHSSLPSVFTSAGHSLSPQGECFLLNTIAPGFNSLFASYTANSISPSLAVSVPNVVPVDVPGIPKGQAVVDVMPSASNLPANPPQVTSAHSSFVHTMLPAGILNSTTNPTAYPAPEQSLSLCPVSSPLTERLQSDQATEPSPETEEGAPQLSLEAPQVTENSTPPSQAPPSADSFVGVTPSLTATTVDSLLNSKSQTETGEGPGLTEGFAAQAAVGSVETVDLPVSGDSAAPQTVQSAGKTMELLHQECLSEEGGSTPKRKLRLVIPEKASRPPTALERKIR